VADAEQKKASMNRSEFARFVGISVPTLDRLLRDRKVGCVRLGGRVLFTERHAEELFEKFEVKAREERKHLRIAG
jgi:hypothetical protein